MQYPVWARIFVAVALSGAVLIAVGVARLSLPIFDDFCRGSANPSTEFLPTGPHTGILQAMTWAYFNWSGRWASIPVEITLLGTIDMTRWYPFILFFLWTVYATGTYLAFRRCLPTAPLVGTSVFLLLFLSSSEGISETLMSVVSSVEYVGSSVLAILCWAVFEHNRAVRVHAGRWSRFLPHVGVVVVSGLHELAGLLLMIAFAVRFASDYWNTRTIDKELAIFGSCLALGLAISVLAPGNAVRAAYMFSGADSGPGAAAKALVGQLFSKGKLWLFGDLRFWAATIWLACVVALTPFAWPTPRHQLTVRLAIVTVFLIGFAFPSVAMKSWMPVRTLALVYIAFLSCWFMLIVVETSILARSFHVERKLLQWVGVASLMVFAGSAALEGNMRDAVRDMRFGEAQNWHEQVKSRIDNMKSAAISGIKEVRIARVTANPVSLPPVTVHANPDYSANLCMRWYFKLDKVYTPEK